MNPRKVVWVGAQIQRKMAKAPNRASMGRHLVLW